MKKVTRVTNEVIQINEKLGDFFVDIAKLVFAGCSAKYAVGYGGK